MTLDMVQIMKAPRRGPSPAPRKEFTPARLEMMARREATRQGAKYVSHTILIYGRGPALLSVRWMTDDLSMSGSLVQL